MDMEYKEQVKTVKYIKEALKFLKIGTTMLAKAADDIEKDNKDSNVAKNLRVKYDTMQGVINNFDDCIVESFKTEQKMPGCQLMMEFYE